MAQVKREDQIGGAVLSLKGDFVGGDETDALKEGINKIAEEEGKRKLIIDFKKANYINSTALGALISAHAHFAKKDGKIILCNMDKSIKNVFVITKLALVFEIAETLEEAIKLMSK